MCVHIIIYRKMMKPMIMAKKDGENVRSQDATGDINLTNVKAQDTSKSIPTPLKNSGDQPPSGSPGSATTINTVNPARTPGRTQTFSTDPDSNLRLREPLLED